MIKAIKFVQILSIILFLIVLSLGYAYLPVRVQLLPYSRELLVPRDFFFYLAGGLFLALYIITSIFMQFTLNSIQKLTNEITAVWWRALPVAINIYLTLLVGFTVVFNNPESIPTTNYNYLNYMGPIILLFWLVGFVVSLVQSRRTSSSSNS